MECSYELTRSDIRRSFQLQLGVGRPYSYLPAGLTALAVLLILLDGDYREAATVLMVVGLVTVGLVLPLMEWTAYRAVRDLVPPLRLSLGPDGFELSTGVSRSSVAWAALREVSVSRSHVFLRLRGGGGVLVPRRALSDQALAQLSGWADAAGIRTRTF